MKLSERIKERLITSFVVLSIFVLGVWIGLSTKSLPTTNGVDHGAQLVDTIQVMDTIPVYDTVKVIEKVKVLPRTKAVDFVYLFSTKYELIEMYAEARRVAASDPRRARAIMNEAKPISKKFTRYKKHLVYVK